MKATMITIRIRRWLSLLFACVLMLCVFAGCGTTSNGSGAESKPNASAPETQQPTETDEPGTGVQETDTPSGEISFPLTEEETTITGWVVCHPMVLNYIENISENSVIKYYAEMSNVIFDAEMISGAAQAEQFPVMIAGGEYCDIISNVHSLYGGGVAKAMEDGVIIDLAEYGLKENMPNYWRYMSDHGYTKWITDDEGRIGSLYIVEESDLTINGMVIRQDYLDQVGKSVPTTYDELHDALTAFQTELGTGAMWVNYLGNGVNNFLGNGFGINTYYYPEDGFYPMYVENGTVHFSYLEEAYRDYLTMMNKWYKEGLIFDDFATDVGEIKIEYTDDSDKLYNGTLSTVSTGIAYLDTHISMLENGTLVPMADVGNTAGETFHYTSQEQGAPQAKYTISTECENVELVMKYWDYFWTEEGAFLATWGLENEAFTYDEDGNPHYTDLVLKHEVGTRVSLGIYCLNDPPTLVLQGRNDAGYTEATLEAGRVWGSNQDGAGYYPTACSLTTEESGDFNAKWNECATYMCESIPRFIMGELNLDEDFDAFVAQLKALGAEECLKIKQASYDRYVNRA